MLLNNRLPTRSSLSYPSAPIDAAVVTQAVATLSGLKNISFASIWVLIRYLRTPTQVPHPVGAPPRTPAQPRSSGNSPMLWMQPGGGGGYGDHQPFPQQPTPFQAMQQMQLEGGPLAQQRAMIRQQVQAQRVRSVPLQMPVVIKCLFLWSCTIGRTGPLTSCNACTMLPASAGGNVPTRLRPARQQCACARRLVGIEAVRPMLERQSG